MKYLKTSDAITFFSNGKIWTFSKSSKNYDYIISLKDSMTEETIERVYNLKTSLYEDDKMIITQEDVGSERELTVKEKGNPGRVFILSTRDFDTSEVRIREIISEITSTFLLGDVEKLIKYFMFVLKNIPTEFGTVFIEKFSVDKILPDGRVIEYRYFNSAAPVLFGLHEDEIFEDIVNSSIATHKILVKVEPFSHNNIEYIDEDIMFLINNYAEKARVDIKDDFRFDLEKRYTEFISLIKEFGNFDDCDELNSKDPFIKFAIVGTFKDTCRKFFDHYFLNNGDVTKPVRTWFICED